LAQVERLSATSGDIPMRIRLGSSRARGLIGYRCGLRTGQMITNLRLSAMVIDHHWKHAA
jgi:hypothetical protein